MPDADPSPAAPDDELVGPIVQLVVSLRGWAETIKATRARRYTGNPGAPGAINLGEIEKALRQAANLVDNHTDLLGRDLRR